MSTLLEVSDVTVDIKLRQTGRRRGPTTLRVLDGVTIGVPAGTTVGLVGESGSGKSTLAAAIVGSRRPNAGRITFDGVDVASFDRRQLKRFRRDTQLIFQDPSSALNPRMTLRDIVGEPMLVHGLEPDRERRDEQATELLVRCGLASSMAGLHPHALSGGQKQRVAVARALAASPRLLIADEPTSALDVSVQSQLLALLHGLQRETGVAILFISHDLGVVRQIAHRVAVMSRGRIVEQGDTRHLFDHPEHAYTKLLLDSYVLPDRKAQAHSSDVEEGPPGADGEHAAATPVASG